MQFPVCYHPAECSIQFAITLQSAVSGGIFSLICEVQATRNLIVLIRRTVTRIFIVSCCEEDVVRRTLGRTDEEAEKGGGGAGTKGKM